MYWFSYVTKSKSKHYPKLSEDTIKWKIVVCKKLSCKEQRCELMYCFLFNGMYSSLPQISNIMIIYISCKSPQKFILVFSDIYQLAEKNKTFKYS